MKIVNFTQEGEEWLQWRRGGIGSSDAAVLMGASPYLTRKELWELKCGFRQEEPVNRFMRHGNDCEPRARAWMNEANNFHLVPLCIEDMEHSHFRASLDGWDKDTRTLVEIKAPVNTNVIDKARADRSVPVYYYAQMQWQMMICKPKRAILAIWDYRTEECIQIEVFSVTDYREEMKEKAHEFWHAVRTGKEPEGCDRDFREVEGEELKKNLTEYAQWNKVEKEAKENKERLKKKISGAGEGNNFRAFGFTVSKTNPRRIYDIEKMRESGLNIEPYLKPFGTTDSWRISCPRN